MSSSLAAQWPVLEVGTKADRVTAVEPERATGTNELSDEFLLSQICNGERSALEELFKRYAGVVRGTAYRVLRDAAEADDLLQEVFLIVYRACRNFDPAKASARFWILQITYRRAISRRRYLTSRHYYNSLDLDEVSESLQDSKSKAALPDKQLIARDILREILPKLSEDQQETLRLYFYHGYTFEEIAAKLGQTVGNVSHHYYRGLERLRRSIFDRKPRKSRSSVPAVPETSI